MADALSPTQLRSQLRLQSRATSEQSQLAFAQSIAHHAVAAYWQALGTGLAIRPAPLDPAPLAAAVSGAARQFGQAVAALGVGEAAAQLGLLYTSVLPSEWRSRRGVFYTPPALADRLLDQAQAAGANWSSARVLDPAAGAGAFLLPVARRMLDALPPCAPAVALQNLAGRLRGFETDPFAAWMAEVFLEAQALPWVVASGRRLGPVVTVRDSLLCDEHDTFDLVVGNPPFGRQILLPALRERFARSLYGHANLYGLFMDLALRLVRPQGLVSFLTPSSFLAGEYFKNLRALLWTEAPPVSLDFVSARKGVFEDVLQETLLATYRKGGKRSRAAVSFLRPQAGEPLRPQAAGAFTLPGVATAPWLLARHTDETPLARTLRTLPSRLADWGYRVSTGPLVWNRHKPQLIDRPEPGSVPLIWAESVTSDGRFVLRCERRNHKPFLRLAPGDDWLVVRTPCVLLQRTTAKEQARRLIAAEMPADFLARHGGVTVENHLNMLVPTAASPSVGPFISPALLAAVLNSGALDRAFRCLSGSVAVSAYELENLPLPAAADLLALLDGDRRVQSVAAACATLYGLDDEA
jgi:adenine-specific DNA-methyltransferase